MRKIILVALLDGADPHARGLSFTDRDLARELGEMLVYVGVEPDSEHFLDTVLKSATNDCNSKAETVEYLRVAFEAAVAKVNKIQQVKNGVERDTLPPSSARSLKPAKTEAIAGTAASKEEDGLKLKPVKKLMSSTQSQLSAF